MNAHRDPGSLVSRADRLLRPSRTTVYPLVMLVLWPVAWGATMAAGGDPPLVDFVARWTGGRMVASGRAGQLYDPDAQYAVQRGLFEGSGDLSWFVSPPWEAVALVPLGLLPFAAAGVIWTALSLAAWTLALLLLRTDLERPRSAREWRRTVLVVMASVPVLELFFSGQNTAFVLLWLVLTWKLIRTRPFLAGMVLGLALVKPHLVLLLPVLWLLERRWAALGGLLVTGLASIALGALVVGPESLEAWLAALGSDLYVGEVNVGQTLKNAGAVGLMTAILHLVGATSLAWVVTVGSLTAAFWGLQVVRRRATSSHVWWVAVMLSVVAAPHAMVYDMVLVLPAILLALSRRWVPNLRVAVAATWVAFWAVPPLAGELAALGVSGSLLAIPWHALPLIALAWLVIDESDRPPSCRPTVPPSGAGPYRAQDEP